MKKITVTLLILLTVLPAAGVWAGSKMVYVAPMQIHERAISRADAAILTEILIGSIPKYCRQADDSALVVVSTPDSAAVVIESVISRKELTYSVELAIVAGDSAKVFNLMFPNHSDFVGGFRVAMPHTINRVIEPAVFELTNRLR